MVFGVGPFLLNFGCFVFGKKNSVAEIP